MEQSEGGSVVPSGVGAKPNNPGGMLMRVSNHNPQTIEFDELMNTSIDAITQRIKMKNSKSKDRSPSVPKLNFRNMKEFQEQDWLSYAHKLEESI